MKAQVSLHLLAVVVALIFVGVFNAGDYAVVFYSILFSHFLLAVVNWSKRPLRWQRTVIIMFPLVVTITFFLEYIKFPISVYFGIHWLLAELYFSETSKEHLVFRSIYLALFFGLFFTTINHDAGILKRDNDTLSLIIASLLTLYILAYFVFDKKGKLNKKLVAVDLSYLFFAVGLYQVSGSRILAPYIIMVHLLQFIFYYLPGKKIGIACSFIGLNLLVSGIFFVMIKESVLFFSNDEAVIFYARVFGYFHITHAFLTSRYNPQVLRKYLVTPFYKSA